LGKYADDLVIVPVDQYQLVLMNIQHKFNSILKFDVLSVKAILEAAFVSLKLCHFI
jgi:hypothetical protein